MGETVFLNEINRQLIEVDMMMANNGATWQKIERSSDITNGRLWRWQHRSSQHIKNGCESNMSGATDPENRRDITGGHHA
jgi:hypothetical protein